MIKKEKILVIGSSNIDMIAKVDRLPTLGETVGNATFVQNFGGKGANQAVAAARLGGCVNFVTSLGNDVYAQNIIKYFADENISILGSNFSSHQNTGVALIFVDKNGANSIAVAPGANSELLSKNISQIDELLSGIKVVLAQGETPVETTKYIFEKAKAKNITTILNPAPAFLIDKEFMQMIDILIVNESEAEFVSDLNFNDYSVERIAKSLQELGAKDIVITLGNKGLYAIVNNNEISLPAYRVKAIDTTAAGDSFCGALAVSLLEDNLNKDALMFASATAALTVTKLGAGQSIPYYKEVLDFVKNNKL